MSKGRKALGKSRVVSVAAVAALVVGHVMGANAAFAAPGDHSEARSQFLSGSILTGIDLDSVAGLAGTEAVNEGGPVVTDITDLDLTVLSALNVNIPGGVSIPLGQLLQLGAVNQYSAADDNGVSRAASGAVSNAGIIDTSGSGEFPASATLDLMALLPETPLLSTANLSLAGVTGVAALDASVDGGPADNCGDISAPENCLDYTIAGATTNIGSPAVGAISTTATAALTTLSNTLNGLSDTILDGLLGGVLDSLDLLGSIVPGLSIGSNDLEVSVTADLAAALDPILGQEITVAGVTLNAAAGTLTVDWEDIVGLNGLPPNTPLLSATTLSTVAANAAAALTELQGEINTVVAGLLDNVNVQISGGICLLRVVVCTAGLNISFDGSLQDLLDNSEQLTITGSGLLAALNPILGPLTSTIQGATSALVLPVVNSAVSTAGNAISGVVTAASTALSEALTLISTVANVVVNVQEEGSAGPGSYAEVATRITLLGGSALTIDLGRAEVGPNDIVAYTPTLTATTPVAPGEDTEVTSDGWPPLTEVSLQLTDSEGNPVGSPVVVTTDEDGNIPAGTPVPIPADAEDGTEYTVVGTDEYGNTAASDTLVVDGGATDADATDADATDADATDADATDADATDADATDADATDADATDADATDADATDADATDADATDADATDADATDADATDADATDADATDADATDADATDADATDADATDADATDADATDADATDADATDADATDADATDADATDADATDADATDADATDADATDADATDADATDADATDADATDADATDADATDADATDADATDADATDADATDADATDADATDADATDADATDADATDADATDADATDADATDADATDADATDADATDADATDADATDADATDADATDADATDADATDADATDADATDADATDADATDADATDADATDADATDADATDADATDADATDADATDADATDADATDGDTDAGELGITIKHPVIEREQVQSSTGTGFAPGEVVTGVMNSDPIALGTQVANTDGTVTFTWTIPAGTDLGAHTVTLTGEDSGSVSIGFQVVAKGLAATGSEPGPAIPLALMLLAAGALAVVGSRQMIKKAKA
ncbi:choice-of-anchor G family protein [Microbacterium ginsengiterrae]|uniref:choice-of-anchor G family protein n=1 Tax=Microbacterium ginsengiterrae TaxID=546115 RepID=UPI0031DEDFEA